MFINPVDPIKIVSTPFETPRYAAYAPLSSERLKEIGKKVNRVKSWKIVCGVRSGFKGGCVRN